MKKISSRSLMRVLSLILAAALLFSVPAFAAGGNGSGGGNSALTLQDTDPADGATDVATDVKISIHFSNNVSESSIKDANLALISLAKEDGTAVELTKSVSSDNNYRQYLYAEPAAALDGGTTYVLTIAAGVQAKNGNKTSSAYTIKFTTKAADAAELITPSAPQLIASNWALTLVTAASENGIIPASLTGKDLTTVISRQDFAALCVKVYEAMTGKTAEPAAVNPFTDCTDTEVLKAYNLGITSGTSATTFSPDSNLSREQAATMLTNTYKKAAGLTELKFDMPTALKDDTSISGWARESVYFMYANTIVQGTGNDNFTPLSDVTSESALIMGVNLLNYFTGK